MCQVFSHVHATLAYASRPFGLSILFFRMINQIFIEWTWAPGRHSLISTSYLHFSPIFLADIKSSTFNLIPKTRNGRLLRELKAYTLRRPFEWNRCHVRSTLFNSVFVSAKLIALCASKVYFYHHSFVNSHLWPKINVNITLKKSKHDNLLS